eukprot:scaffold18928_cov69-Phaeocystis_antarctica.AAC.11
MPQLSAAHATNHCVRGPPAYSGLFPWAPRVEPPPLGGRRAAVAALWACPKPPILMRSTIQATPLARSCPCSAAACSRAARRPRDARTARSPCCHRTSPASSRPRRAVSRPEPAPSSSSWDGPSACECQPSCFIVRWVPPSQQLGFGGLTILPAAPPSAPTKCAARVYHWPISTPAWLCAHF